MRAICCLVPLTAGCFDLDLDSQPYLVLDYVIDRTRVVAVQAIPPVAESGTATYIDALVLSPHTDRPEILGTICGLRTDIEVDVDRVSCFDNPDLVQPVVDTVPDAWVSPSLDGIACDEEDLNFGLPCASQVPLMIEARSEVDVARASITIGLSVGPPTNLSLPIPIEIEDPGPVSAGDRVELVVVSERAPVALDHIAWWVDGGVLLGTGRTRTYGVEDVVSDNTLVIPDDWSGPLRVAAVAVESGITPMSWDLITLDVR